MSALHFGAVLHRLPELRERAPAWILAVIADSADAETGFTFWKTLRAVARCARLSIRTAREALRILEARGYIRTELRGDPGRQSMRWRVLFNGDGARSSEEELYPQTPAKAAGGKRKTPARTAGGPANAAGGPAAISTPPNNPLIGISVPSPSLSKEAAKSSLRGKRARKIPDPTPEPDRTAERERQKAGLKALAAKLAGGSAGASS